MKRVLKSFLMKLLTFSLTRARKEQGYEPLALELENIIPDLKDQYSTFIVEGKYLETKVRNQHAFQVQLIMDALKPLKELNRDIVVVDIGDSSGNHLIYLNKLLGNLDTVSVNLDKVAIEKIRSKGLKAIYSYAEDLHNNSEFNKETDIFFSLEMLEHLENPTGFLKNMAERAVCKRFVLSVPLINKSRVGLHQIRNMNFDIPMSPENTHIYELSPDDWDLLFKFSGWKVVKRVKYTQYPRSLYLFFMKYLWRKFDFDGFYGVILEKDDTYSKRYG